MDTQGPTGAFKGMLRSRKCLGAGLQRQVLIVNRGSAYEADTSLSTLALTVLCCLSCHRKAPWLSYFKPSVPLTEGYLENLKKKA